MPPIIRAVRPHFIHVLNTSKLSAQWRKQARATFPSRGPTKMKDELDEKLEPHHPSQLDLEPSSFRETSFRFWQHSPLSPLMGRFLLRVLQPSVHSVLGTKEMTYATSQGDTTRDVAEYNHVTHCRRQSTGPNLILAAIQPSLCQSSVRRLQNVGIFSAIFFGSPKSNEPNVDWRLTPTAPVHCGEKLLAVVVVKWSLPA
jgi:hypothetical protein